jgi:phosphohistidine phosphatase
MYLYLIQHGEAKSEVDDPARPLTGQGARDISKVGYFVSGIEVDSILHSGKLRAEQTAEILKDFIKSRAGVSRADALAPMDDPSVWAERLKALGTENSLMLVGHLPHLGRLASLLLCGSPDARAMDFRMGGVACLRRYEDGTWRLQWMVVPEMFNNR